ncbi:hypothetical protein [Pedobacter nanyangensis]|uniref:hypothetical protein n=1 Tax=Pedobacter nanyangensis TaxID=1562389 RepID=UPI0013B44E05|nr:hypothetical protein [Pedobacter nanyangensis]
MKNLLFLFLLIGNMAYSQIKNFEDESQYLLSLQELVSQSFTESYGLDDWDEGWRQHLEFDPMSMNLVFYKKPYHKADSGKISTAIKWLTKSVIPLDEIDTLIGDTKKNTITIKMKGGKNSIKVYALAPDPQWLGKEYYEAGKEKEIIIQSDKLLKIRNLEKRLNWHISQLQNFHQKKMDLANYLNNKQKQKVEYQSKDTLNYRSDKKFKLIQEFQLDNSGQWLSVAVERRNIYDKPITEKQSVRLKDITEVIKDISIILKTGEENKVMKTTTVFDDQGEKQMIETVDTFFFLQFWYEKNNGHIGDEIVALLKQLGLNSNKGAWLD